MLYYLQQKTGKGNRNMAKKEAISYMEQLEKNRNVANEVNLGTAMFAGISAGMVAIAGIMGGAAEISTTIGMNHLTAEVREMGSYMDERNALMDKFTQGQISKAEFDAGIKALDSRESMLSHAKASGNERVATLAESIESTDEMGDTLLKLGVPRMSAVMLAPGAAAWTVSEMIKRKYDRKLRELKAQENEGM